MTAVSPRVSGTWSLGRGKSLPWGPTGIPHVMAILNLTPDSFSDGGRFGSSDTAAEAVQFGLSCQASGAAIIDIGAESTRPGAAPVDASTQIARMLPTVDALAAQAIVSVDTTLASVAAAALNAGAHIINDVSAGTGDNHMLSLIAERGCGVVLMHRLCPPGADSYSDRYQTAPEYGDVVSCVKDFLRARADAAMDAGISSDCIALDPGLGFGKSVRQNIELVAGLRELCDLGFPVLVSASRKSFLGAICQEPDPSRRDGASIAAALLCAQSGARVIRAHAVAAHVQALRAVGALGC